MKKLSGESERLKLRRQNYLDCATIPTRLIDREIFPMVAEALKKGASNNPTIKAEGKAAFKEICAGAKIPRGMFTDSLWETLLHVDSKMADTPGWIPG